jgi:hypothetical protein
MNTPVEQSVSPIKEHMLKFIEKHPNQEIYHFAAGPGVDAQAAVQAGVEVASEQHVPIVVYVQEDEEPTAQKRSETWTRAQ